MYVNLDSFIFDQPGKPQTVFFYYVFETNHCGCIAYMSFAYNNDINSHFVFRISSNELLASTEDYFIIPLS